MRTPQLSETTIGLLAIIGAHFTWGILVVYLKALEPVPPFLILAHRTVWSVLTLGAFITLINGWGRVFDALRVAKTRWALILTSLLIGANWFVFIWAVVTDRVLSASLGYYINPLVNVLLGMIFLGERLRKLQFLAIGIAMLGVVNQGFAIGAFPLVSVFLAVTFGFYGLLRKTTPVDAVSGLFIEVTILALPAVAYFAWLAAQGAAIFPVAHDWQIGLLLASGVITSLPLVLFTVGARRLNLTTIGVVQYLAPTLQFILGVYVYNEAFNTAQILTFALIWLAVVVFSIDALRHQRRKLQATV